MDGQTSIFDHLQEAPTKASNHNTKRQRNQTSYSHLHFTPTREIPTHCVMCGKAQTNWADFSINHAPLGYLGEQRTCTAMNLTMNHVRYYAMRIRAITTGEYPPHWKPEDSTQCCWDKTGLHGKAVRKPTALQMGDHLRERIDRARDAWGVRAELFDQWLGLFLVEQQVLKYALDPEE